MYSFSFKLNSSFLRLKLKDDVKTKSFIGTQLAADGRDKRCGDGNGLADHRMPSEKSELAGELLGIFA